MHRREFLKVGGVGTVALATGLPSLANSDERIESSGMKNVEAFFAKVEEDKRLQEHIKALHKKAQENIDEAIADLVEIASKAGCEFTADDYIEVRSRTHKHEEICEEFMGYDLGCCNSNWSCCRVKTM